MPASGMTRSTVVKRFVEEMKKKYLAAQDVSWTETINFMLVGEKRARCQQTIDAIESFSCTRSNVLSSGFCGERIRRAREG